MSPICFAGDFWYWPVVKTRLKMDLYGKKEIRFIRGENMKWSPIGKLDSILMFIDLCSLYYFLCLLS